MPRYHGLERPHQANWQGLIDNILRKGTPERAYHLELFHDREVMQAIVDRFDLVKDLSPDDPDFERRKAIALFRFLGFDYVRAGLVGLNFPLNREAIEDTATLKRDGGRAFMNEHKGPIQNWEDFEKYPWPDASEPEAVREIEWYQENLPEDMCIIGLGGLAHFAELLTWLMGYESLCYALYDQRDLVAAISTKLQDFYSVAAERIVQYDRVKIVFGSDDMGFKTGLLISAKDMREFVLPGHKTMAEIVHNAGRPYMLHSCGNLSDIIDDLIDDVKIDAKHSFEDTIEDVRKVKHTYGRRIGILGGIDVDFLCRSDEAAIRQRVRETLDICMPGGGYCLGTGNSVANYIPLDNYLAMVDEGRLYGS